MADRTQFRHAVALDRPAIEARADGFTEFGTERRRRAEDRLQRTEIELVDGRMLGKRQGDRRHDPEIDGFVVLGQPQEHLQVETRHGDHRGAGRGIEIEEDQQSVDMEKRQECRCRGAAVDRRDRGELGEVRHQIPVGQHDALGQPGRPGGIGQDNHVVVQINRNLLFQGIAAEFEQRRRALGFSDNEDFPDTRPLRGCPGCVEELRDRDQSVGAGIGQLVTDLVLGIGRIDGGYGPAGPGNRMENREILRDVRRHQRDRATGAEVLPDETAGECLDGRHQFGGRDGASRRPIDNHDGFGIPRQTFKDVLGCGLIPGLDIAEPTFNRHHTFCPHT